MCKMTEFRKEFKRGAGSRYQHHLSEKKLDQSIEWLEVDMVGQAERLTLRKEVPLLRGSMVERAISA